MKFKLSAVVFLVCLLLLMPTPASAQPPALPHMFYGSLSIGGQATPLGTVVEARGTNVATGITGNPISTTVVGQYSSASEPRLYVQGSNIKNGDIIEFYVNGAKANETYQFQSGAITKLNLTIASAPPPPPASLSITNLSVNPAEVESEEAVTITALVANTSGTGGSYTVVLNINGVKEAEKRVTVAAGSSQDVSFSVSKEEAGRYSVAVDGLSGSFTVVVASEEATPPAPPAGSEEVTPPAPEEVIPPAPEEVIPPAPSAQQPPSKVNWVILGPIIGVAVFLAIFLPIRLARRRVVR